MNAIKGTYHGGEVRLSAPPDWPEGTEVVVAPVVAPAEPHAGDEEPPPDAEEIARRLALMDQIQPLILTPQEEAEWAAARRELREAEKENFDRHAERLRRIWE